MPVYFAPQRNEPSIWQILGMAGGQIGQALIQRKQQEAARKALEGLLQGTTSTEYDYTGQTELQAPSLNYGMPSLSGMPSAPAAAPTTPFTSRTVTTQPNQMEILQRFLGIMPTLQRADMLEPAGRVLDAYLKGQPGAGEQFTLGEGQTRFDPTGKPIAAVPKSPTAVKKFSFHAPTEYSPGGILNEETGELQSINRVITDKPNYAEVETTDQQGKTTKYRWNKTDNTVKPISGLPVSYPKPEKVDYKKLFYQYNLAKVKSPSDPMNIYLAQQLKIDPSDLIKMPELTYQQFKEWYDTGVLPGVASTPSGKPFKVGGYTVTPK